PAPGIRGRPAQPTASATRIGQKKSHAGSRSCATKLSVETSDGGTAKTRNRLGSNGGAVWPRGRNANHSLASSTLVSTVAKTTNEPPRQASASGSSGSASVHCQ